MLRRAEESVTDDAIPSESTQPQLPPAVPTDCGRPGPSLGRRRALAALISAYGGDSYRLLTDLANLLEMSVAYVDRLTIDAHLERPLSDTEWVLISRQFTAMAFDEHIGNAGTIRTDWIDDIVLCAGTAGRGDSSLGRPCPR